MLGLKSGKSWKDMIGQRQAKGSKLRETQQDLFVQILLHVPHLWEGDKDTPFPEVQGEHLS